MCPHEQNIKRIMLRLHYANTKPVNPPMNYELLALKLSIFKQKYNYSYSQLSKLLGFHSNSIQYWVRRKNKPTQKTYNYILNFLETHS